MTEKAACPSYPYQRFLMLKPVVETPLDSELRVIVNWFEELKRLVPIK